MKEKAIITIHIETYNPQNYSSITTMINQLTKDMDVKVTVHTEVNVHNDIESIINNTLKKFFPPLKMDDLKTKSRKREVVVPRQMIMTILKEKTNMSMKSIGHMFGERDHSTVIHSLTAVSDQCDTDRVYKRIFDNVNEHLTNLILEFYDNNTPTPTANDTMPEGH